MALSTSSLSNSLSNFTSRRGASIGLGTQDSRSQSGLRSGEVGVGNAIGLASIEGAGTEDTELKN